MNKKAKQAISNVPRFEVSPPPPMPRMMKRRGGKNLMPKAVRRNVKIH